MILSRQPGEHEAAICHPAAGNLRGSRYMRRMKIAIISVAAQARIYWLAADFVPENGHFLPFLTSVEALKQRKASKS